MSIVPFFRSQFFPGFNGKGKFRLGVVVGAKNQNKTIRVAVNRAVLHLKYKKWIINTKKYMVHDENNMCDIGDRVQIQMSKPHSKWKSWEVSKIVRKDPPSALLNQYPEFKSVPRELYEHRMNRKNEDRYPRRILVNDQVIKQKIEDKINSKERIIKKQKNNIT